MTPTDLGFSMPPEWAPQEAVWLSWPVADARHWGGNKRDRIEAKFAEIAAAISSFELVRVNVCASDLARARSLCLAGGGDADRIEFFEHQHNDVWCRDHGPIFVKNDCSGEVAVTNWKFNSWGGKFAPWDDDDRIPCLVADKLGFRRFDVDVVLEGGSIEVNGCGQLLTTESVLLNRNRNPNLSRESLERVLKRHLGIREVLWLASGIQGDDTDGHIDDLVRFVDDQTLVACTSVRSPDRDTLDGNLARLRQFRDPSGKPFCIHEIPLPDPCEIPGWRLPVLPASYVNFLIVNGGVLVPTFRQSRSDDRALALFRELFPGREIIGIDCLELVEEGGALHCISQQQPA